ncbi:hypothetical protein [Nocardioides sp. GXZ039]|uniref:hypothetical protein n=1 Tax=Nocardioides sp. GXZ039 TaxID=3136018 RepID=UPI0030F481AC
MGWEAEIFSLLDDLEQQAESLYDADRAPEIADRSRTEYQQVTLAARLMASIDRDVTLHVSGVGPLSGRLDRVANGWCLLASPAGDWIIPLPALAAIDGAADRAVPEIAWSPLSRLGLGSALRHLADAGERCVLHRLDRVRHDGPLRRIGGDFVEVAEGDPPRITLVSFATLAAVQSRDV